MTYIYFNVQKVFDFLIKNGHVYTIRKRYIRPRHNTISPVKRDGKLTDIKVIVNEIGDASDELLNKYCPESSFNSVDEWKQALHDVNKAKNQDAIRWTIYKAEVMK